MIRMKPDWIPGLTGFLKLRTIKVWEFEVSSPSFVSYAIDRILEAELKLQSLMLRASLEQVGLVYPIH